MGAQNRLDRLDFQYSTNATALNNGTWIDENALDFSTPNQTATIGALDGNSASNRTFIGSITIPSLSITPGTTFWLRWQDFDPSGADDGLSIDDFTINFTQIILPTCTEPTTQPTNLTLTPTQTAVTGNFDAAVPAVDGYLVVRSLSSTLSSFPVDAQIFCWQALGGGTVVASDFSSSFYRCWAYT
ncbi:MAG: hypothetical protein IPP48_02220 [Chitinophagaceae bacterium]|nr:hypothetical protein [Chitinophagaceae bacterium]